MKDFINFNGTKLPVKFGMYILSDFMGSHGLSSEEFFGKLADLEKDPFKNFKFLADLAWAGVEAGHKEKGKEPPITQEKFTYNLGMNEIQQVMEVFTSQFQTTLPPDPRKPGKG